MSINRVIIPRFPGLFSAMGLLCTDETSDFALTLMLPLSVEHLEQFNAGLLKLKREGQDWLKGLRTEPGKGALSFSADMRYRRQNYELSVPFGRPPLSRDDIPRLAETFHAAHARAYGHAAEGEGIQVVCLRVRAVRHLPRPVHSKLPPARGVVADEALLGQERVWFPSGPARKAGGPGAGETAPQPDSGPAIVREREATTLVGMGWQLALESGGNLILERLTGWNE